MLTKENLVGLLREMFPRLAATYGVSKIALFGSFAAGIPRGDSDVDLLVEFNRPMGLQFMELADDLENQLGRRVDILTGEGLSDIRIFQVKKHILETLEYVCPA